jgi:hypothetical protein
MKNSNTPFLLLFVLLFAGCTPTINVQKTVLIDYENTEFTPPEIVKTIRGNITINLRPIDATEINEDTYRQSVMSGNYEKERKQVFVTYFSKMEEKNLNRTDRNRYEGLKKAFNFLEGLQNTGEISEEIVFNMKGNLIGSENTTMYDGTEVENFSFTTGKYPETYNPYYLNGKYLSVIEVELENNGEKVEKFNIENIQIISGNEQLYPFKIKFFEDNLEGDLERIKNIHRLNMPEEVILAPNQKIKKYISFPALNSFNKELTINHIEGNSVINFNYTVKKSPLSKTFIVDKYLFYPSNTASTLSAYFVLNLDGKIYPINDDFFFVPVEKVNKRASVYAIGISTAGTTYYGKVENFKFADFKKHIVQLPMKDIKYLD